MIAALVAILAQLAAPQRSARELAPRDTPAIVTRARIDTSTLVNFRVLVQPETVYVGQQANYQLGVFLDETVRDRMRSMEALAPEMRSMMAYEPPSPLAGFPLRNASGHRYEAHVYQRPIFPLSAGRVAIPPARLLYAMPLSYSFFSREESFELRSDSAVVVALEPPRSGRPADWTGAVGMLRLSAAVDSAAARVGDALRLVVRVSGEGNVKLFPRPALTLPWASATPEGERVTMSADSMHIGGTKEFDWVITPRVPGRVEVPPVRYPYFDPYARQYQVAESAPVALYIAAGALASADTSTVSTAPRWMLRTAYRGALPPPLYRSPTILLALLLLPVPVLLLASTRRPSKRRRRAVPPAVTLRALARSEATVREARTIRRSFLSAVADRLGATQTMLAEPATLRHVAVRAGVTPETADRAEAFMAELNAAAFDIDGAWTGNGVQRAYDLYRAIDREARARRSVRASRAASASLALVLALALAAGARASDNAYALFARGLDAYAHGKYASATNDFAVLAAHEPRAPDAWANMGTAAYSAGDTVRALVGWQRALRLEPLATDARERLDLLSPTAPSSFGFVPEIPLLPLAVFAAALWVLAWLSLGWQARTRGAAAPPLRVAVPAVAMLVALLFAGATFLLDRRINATDLAVVARDAPLHVLPALGSDRGSTLRTGDIARVLEADGAWARVAADGGRQGWMDASALAPIPHD
ncbi:MAG TPA: BatD family protein [Gemmatimonadaceae bacterium]|nr:BatD family protein [Gemmatimonadaceae bacterium]